MRCSDAARFTRARFNSTGSSLPSPYSGVHDLDYFLKARHLIAQGFVSVLHLLRSQKQVGGLAKPRLPI